ncbi:TIM barrel protein [Novosphingobium sp. SG919]|uniref:TIM barrel protein n=1 Tax=unclassified Novosphingobium TaxID=2644732 RepID=UPI00182AED6D|nr:sugar phosphate isomerase/epimerase [Novosphingobium sp. SG919]NMN89105.1 sugar phosphate isomerase/epimerase [Novosphingobium sp. SG916]
MEDRFKYGVSLYSFTEDFGSVMSIEEGFDHIADTGATGIEILGETHVTGYPTPDKAWLDRWFGLLDRTGLEPTNMCSWVDTKLRLGQSLSADEGVAELTRDLTLAHQLGFKFLRPKFGVISADLDPDPIWAPAVERVLDLAHKLDIVICPEIHSPTPINHPVVHGYIDFIEHTGTKNFALLIDTGIFQDRPLKSWVHEVPEGDSDHAKLINGMKVNPEELVGIAPYIAFIQAKFHHIDDNLHDENIPWEKVIPVLKRIGYTGYLSSEYEGVREPWVAIDQVRRQHVLLRRLEAACGAVHA